MLSNENSRETLLLEKETRSEDNHDNSSNRKPSNETLLSMAFVSFFVFTVAQTIAAYLAHSKAMMGDSIAMYVDAFTYAFNLWAERMKSRVEVDNDNADFVNNNDTEEQQQLDLVSIQRRKSRDKRKMTLILELVPPLVSVTTLVTATIWILHDSISDLQFLTSSQMDDDNNGNDDDENDQEAADADAGDNYSDVQPNTIVMMVFSSLNLLVDVINVFFFAKADHAFGYDTVEEDFHIDETTSTLETTFDNNNNNSSPSGSESNNQNSLDYHHPLPQTFAKSGANLNMCSAYTHVFADTIRSIAVLIAATLGECVDSITPEAADAAATGVVSAVILLALIPLVSGMKRSFGQLMVIWREESSEREMEMERAASTQHSHHALGTSTGTSSRLT
uniref:Uncharacterized protein n=1 Tax=Chaetoceros debilis TaxID=122233 RepID=A0A7S3QHS5_9STRA|mmetsp:Transcript_6653/g.9760  ORF Transcript_6653/g.9760 Transcript_6653/m.9760 type:complete len:392 (+) Transcript_6653:95-1270(+)